MTRVFLLVMDSAGIGGAPDAADFFNGDTPDTGSNTIGHIAEACGADRAEEGRTGPLKLPTLDAMGLGRAISLASGLDAPGLGAEPRAPGVPRPRCRTARTRPLAIGNWRACRCRGTGTISPRRSRPFRPR